MDNLLDGLNPAQRDAVTSPASVLQVLAPPGSGKTKTLTARVAYLISHEHLRAWNIIVCTFTRKSAEGMRQRIRGFVGKEIASNLILGTFHSVALRFLQAYGDKIGIRTPVGVAETDDSKAIIKRIVDRHKYTIEPKIARSRISGLKCKGITAGEFYAKNVKKAEQHEFAAIYTEYEEILKAENLLDYDDILLRCTELLKIYPQCVSTIEAVLIDEYQDTNNVQYELMSLMAQRHRRVTIVGDPDQSIYGWRSAEIKNLSRMRKDYPESIVINLQNNYRSSGCILNSAMAVIEQDESRPKKPLVATHCVGERPVLRHLASSGVEAQWVVEEVERVWTLTAGLLNYSDFAVLIRSSYQSLSIEQALVRAGLPYRMVGGTKFFDRVEIKTVLDYLRVINQPEHNDALKRVLNVPSRKIGEVTKNGLLEEAERRKVSLWSVILSCARGKRPETKISTQAQNGIDLFVKLILTAQKKLKTASILDLIADLLQKLSFEAFLKEKYPENWKERWANVEELVSQATQIAQTVAEEPALPVVEGIEQRQDNSEDILARFLANVSLAASVDQSAAEANQVTISTIHAAKGLEWPVVFIPGVYDGSIPHSRADDTDEERRLLYVGMTRAQGLLYLSCPVKKSSKESEGGESTLSKFVAPKKIQNMFDLQGPLFCFPVVQDLARILRRPCPALSEVEAAQGKIERIADDKYPLNRSELDGDDNGREYLAKQPLSKRRKVDMVAMTGLNVPVTMNDSSKYSTASTTMSGFVSANDHMQTLKQAEATRMLSVAAEATVQRTHRREELSQTTSSQKVGRLSVPTSSRPKIPKKRPSGQGSITAFFQRPNPTRSEESLPVKPAPPLAPMFRSVSTSHLNQSPLADTTNINREPRRVSQPLSTHKIGTAPMTSKPRRIEHEEVFEAKRHLLLSSSPVKSPVKPEDLGDQLDFDADEPPSPIRPTADASKTTSTGFVSASTFHTTTLSQLQTQAAPQRRTLGMRRSVQVGWTTRKQFQPPRPQK